MYVKPENFLSFLSVHIGSSHSLFSLDFGCLLFDCYMSILPLLGHPLHRVPLLNQTHHILSSSLMIGLCLYSPTSCICQRGALAGLSLALICALNTLLEMSMVIVLLASNLLVVISGKKTNGRLDEV